MAVVKQTGVCIPPDKCVKKTDASRTIYTGTALSEINVVAGDTLEEILVKINNKFAVCCGGGPSPDPLVVNAGPDQELAGGTTSTSILGTTSGGIVDTVLWTALSSTGGVLPVISPNNTLAANVTGLQTGTAVLQLSVTDTLNRTETDTITISVGIPATITVNSGQDQSLAAGTTGTSVTATLTVPTGVTVQSQTWSIVSEPPLP